MKNITSFCQQSPNCPPNIMSYAYVDTFMFLMYYACMCMWA